MRTPKFVTLFFILSAFFASTAGIAGPSSGAKGALVYAVGESSSVRGSISVYEIAAGHRLIKTIHTVPNVGDVIGVAASAVTGKLYIAYIDVSGTGMVYCLNIYDDRYCGINRLVPASIGWQLIRTDNCSMFQPGRAARPTTSTSWMPIPVRSFGKYISLIDRTTRSIRCQGRFSKRRKPPTVAAISFI